MNGHEVRQVCKITKNTFGKYIHSKLKQTYTFPVIISVSVSLGCCTTLHFKEITNKSHLVLQDGYNELDRQLE